jgi:putative peptidoglycan lipid II flippase
MRSVGALIVPIAAILIINGGSLAVLLFGYGAATPAQAALMGLIVSVFTLGLLPFTLFYILLRGYYALEDTRTPFWMTVFYSIVMLALMYPLFYLAAPGGNQVAAIALAYAIAYWIALALTWWVLSRRLGSMESRRTMWSLGRMLAAGVLAVLVMLAVLLLLLNIETGGIAVTSKGILLLNVAVTSVIGMATYLAAAWGMRVREVSDALAMAGRMTQRMRRA